MQDRNAYDSYLTVVTQFEMNLSPETSPVNTAHCRNKVATAGSVVRFQLPTDQVAGLAVRPRFFWTSSLPVLNGLLDAGLAGVCSQNPALSNTQPVGNGAVDFGSNKRKVQGYDLSMHASQYKSRWNNPNQNGYYQPMQNYPSSDPVVQHAFNQEHYAAQMANHYQLVAKQNANATEERSARAKWKIE